MDAYSVGIKIEAYDRASSVMAGVSRAMLQAGQHTEQLKQRVVSVKNALVQLVALQGIGDGMLRAAVQGMTQATSAAKEYAYVLNKLEGQGVSYADRMIAINASHANSNRDLTSSLTGNLEKLGDMRAVLNSMPHAAELLPVITDSIKVMRTSGDMHSAHQAEHMTKEGMRALELSGDVSSTRTKDYQEEHIDLMRRAVMSTNGLVGFNQFHNFMKQAGVSRTSLNDDFKFKVAPFLMQEVQGLRTGTMVQATNRALQQGIMTVQAAQNLQNLGLIESRETITKKNVRAVASHGIAGQELFQSNPFEALQKVWIPKILAHNRQIAAIEDVNKRNQAITQAINKIGLNEKATTFLGLMASQQSGIEKHGQIMDAVPKRAQAVKIADQSPVNAALAAETQWKYLMVMIGNVYVPILNRALTQFAQVLNAVNRFIESNPMAAKLIAAAVAATAFVGGVIALGAQIAILVTVLGACGWTFGGVAIAIGVGIIAVTDFIAAFLNWNKIMTWIRTQVQSHMDAMRLVLAVVIDLTNRAVQAFKGLASGIAALVGNIANALKGLHIPLFDGISQAAANFEQFAKGATAQNYVAGVEKSNEGAFTALGLHTAPSHTRMSAERSGGAKGGKIVNNFNMNIHQQPGEDSHAFSKKVANAMVDHLRTGLNSSSAAGGIFESQWHHGGNVGG
jgi:hypothetical protein